LATTIVVLGAVLLCAAPAASARPSGRFPLIGDLSSPSSKGFRAEVFFFGDLVGLELRSGNVSADHLVAGRRKGGRLKARFGRLGRLALRFHPDRSFRRNPCEVLYRGVYRGVLEFAGERHYTELDARRARGRGFLVPPRRCEEASTSAVPFNGGGLRTHLLAISKRPRGVISLSARRLPGEGRLSVEGELEESRERMLITRRAFARVGGRDAFVASAPGAHPAFALLTPPKPFAGSAVFEETGVGRSSWSGDLSAWLPGVGRVALAGPRFSSSFCRRAPGKAGCPYGPTVQRPLSRLQGSGSQSQLLADARLSWSRYLRNSASSAGSTP
jgi:hypothetical protein